MHACMVAGKGTRDLCGADGLTTEDFIDTVGHHMRTGEMLGEAKVTAPSHPERANVDMDKVKAMFDSYDTNNDGTIDIEEFTDMLIKLGVEPMRSLKKRSNSEGA